MDPHLLNPWVILLATLALLGGIAAMLSIACWLEEASATAKEGPTTVWTASPHPLLAVLAAVGVFFLCGLLLSSFVVSVVSVILLLLGGPFLGC
jgi:hypothetical protein